MPPFTLVEESETLPGPLEVLATLDGDWIGFWLSKLEDELSLSLKQNTGNFSLYEIIFINAY